MARVTDILDEDVASHIGDDDHPYYGEIVRLRRLVEDFVSERLPRYDINTFIDSAAPPDIFRMEIRPGKDEPHRNANLWVNAYVSSCYGNGDVRRGSPLRLTDQVITEISAPITEHNHRMVETYGDLVASFSDMLGGDSPEFHTNYEVFLTAAFAIPKPAQQTRLIVVVGMNLTVKELDPNTGKLV